MDGVLLRRWYICTHFLFEIFMVLVVVLTNEWRMWKTSRYRKERYTIGNDASPYVPASTYGDCDISAILSAQSTDEWRNQTSIGAKTLIYQSEAQSLLLCYVVHFPPCGSVAFELVVFGAVELSDALDVAGVCACCEGCFVSVPLDDDALEIWKGANRMGWKDMFVKGLRGLKSYRYCVWCCARLSRNDRGNS
jgi:hypothetical protein